ncbi:hypothetical protein NUSPORA_02773 [Nucleospora cyclopteri]
MCLRYGLKSSKKIRNHSVQEIVCNENVEIWVDNKIKINVKIQCNNPDLFIHDIIRNLITLIEVGITSQYNLQVQGRDNSICFNLGWCNNKMLQCVRQEAFNLFKNPSIHPNYSA